MKTMACLVVWTALATPAFAKVPPEAYEHEKKGKIAYDLRDFEEAAKEFKDSYRLNPDPILLFNIAQSYRLLGNHKEALFFYRRYLDAAPRGVFHKVASEKKADLEHLVEQEERATNAPPEGVTPTAHVKTDSARPESVEAPPGPAPSPPVSAPHPAASSAPVSTTPSWVASTTPPTAMEPSPTRASATPAMPAPVLKDLPPTTITSSVTGVPAAAPSRSRRRAWVLGAVIAGAAVLAAGIAVAFIATSPTDASSPSSHLGMMPGF